MIKINRELDTIILVFENDVASLLLEKIKVTFFLFELLLSIKNILIYLFLSER